MATVSVKAPIAPSVVIHGVTWDDYEAMLRIIGNRRTRINYDRGEMEIMSPLWRHGNGAFLLGRMVDTLVDEFEIPCEGADPVTLRRPDLDKGVEPDRLYYFGDHAARVRGKRDLDLIVDPPPDLVIESDLTSSSIPRMPIFAALGIPEVWRLDDEELQFLRLQPDETYQPRERSLAFPDLLLADASRFVDEGQGIDKTTWVRGFRAFVRANYLPGRPEIGPA